MNILNSEAQKLITDLRTPWKLKWYFWTRLPSLLFWRVKLQQLDSEHSSVSIPFFKKTQNPFKSIYFAAQAGAAEFSTGALAAVAISGKGKLSMLVTGMRCEYHKKASETILFDCNDGSAVFECVNKALETIEGKKLTMLSTGKNAAGEVVSQFWIEWSFKKK